MQVLVSMNDQKTQKKISNVYKNVIINQKVLLSILDFLYMDNNFNLNLYVKFITNVYRSCDTACNLTHVFVINI